MSYINYNDENLTKQNIIKNLFIIFVLLCLGYTASAQVRSENNVNRKVDIEFLYPKIEVVANKSFFNILKVKNNSNFKFTGKIKLNQPRDWKIIGDSEININLDAGDSLKLPIRIIASKNVLGEVAYAIVAVLFDKNNLSVLSEYCFVNIPRISDLKINLPNRIIYFDNKTRTAKFRYKIKNSGNVNEIIQLNFNKNEHLTVDGKKLDELYAYEYSISAHADTTVEIKVNLANDNTTKDFFKLDLNTLTQDTLYKKSLWFNKINSSYFHTIPQENKCAIVELAASDILSTRKPRYSLMVQGSVLLKNNIDLYYFYRNYNLEEDYSDYYNDRGYIGIKNKYLNLQVGTVQNIFNEYVFGFGGISKLELKKFSIGGHFSNNEKTQQKFYGGDASIFLSNKSNISFGYSENIMEFEGISSKVLFAGTNLRFLKKHNLSLKTYFNNTSHRLYKSFETQGFAILGNYSANYSKFKINARIEYGSPEYSGISRGRTHLNVNSIYSLTNKDFINFSYSKHDIVNIKYINDVPQPTQKSFFDSYLLLYNKNLNKLLSFNIGPGFNIEKFNTLYITLGSNDFFKTMTTRAIIGLRFYDISRQLYIRPKIEIGQIVPVKEQNINNNKPRNTYSFNLFTKYRDFSLYAQYENGSKGIYNQYYYFNSGYITKWFYIMPSYNKFFFNNKVNIDLRANYRYDIILEDKYFAFTTLTKFFLPDSWTLWLLNSVNTNTKRDQRNNSSVRYNSVFFEAGIRKEFNCKQPRFQYYDLNIIFFKDLNGNRKREKNEPGLRNVLAAIEPNYEIEDSKVRKDFVSQKLLTGADGNIEYTNIVNGAYNLKYVLIGDMVGNFNREELTHPFTIDEDKTIYIPYLENNRIIGKVILNRDPLSSLGPIDISNIRVIA
ncbi:MAG: hypothetical protein B6I20_08580, partial [Bacteroidetes bacterium 4572_117]